MPRPPHARSFSVPHKPRSKKPRHWIQNGIEGPAMEGKPLGICWNIHLWFGEMVWGQCHKKGNLFWGSLEAHDGHLSELTTRMARLGCYGKYPGNIERDLCTLLEIPIQSLWLEIPVRCEQNRRDIELKKLPVICPHLLYEYLHVS